MDTEFSKSAFTSAGWNIPANRFPTVQFFHHPVDYRYEHIRRYVSDKINQKKRLMMRSIEKFAFVDGMYMKERGEGKEILPPLRPIFLFRKF